ncbi:NAD(P)/FAD-dependent oxidoreductase [Shouchella sp. 1P09AA]|uniref:flavin-containing monooxygenase n=1 Tax=unclassified Shouchella TaxID=2893065 RepID=UPI0039A1E894
MKYIDIVIVGGGQAGLAMAYALKRINLDCIILDENSETGYSWRNRYDSLELFTPKAYSRLYEHNYVGDEREFPTKNDVALYLKEFKKSKNLKVMYGEKVIKVSQKANRNYTIVTHNSTIEAHQVIVATGAFYTPFIPDIHDASIPITLHSANYRNANQIPEGKILIVGGGNTGVQIAAELSSTHEVHLSISKEPKRISTTLLGKSIFWWFDKLQILKLKPNTILGEKLRKAEPLIGHDFVTVLNSVSIHGKLEEISNKVAYFKGKSSLEPDAVIWATGYKNDYSWIKVENALDIDQKPNHHQGISSISGLYYIGLSWQRNRASGLIHGVTEDAEFIAKHIDKNLNTRRNK